MSDPELLLSFQSFNSSAENTILLIHGALSSPREWNTVAQSPFLEKYHLLIPSLPSHSSSRSIRPFSLQRTSHLLAQLIRKQARHGGAHIVGSSLGAHVGLDLASSHPDVVRTLFISGFNIFKPTAFWKPILPYALFSVQNFVEYCVPRQLIRYAFGGAELPRSDTSCTLQLCRDMIETTVSDREIHLSSASTFVMVAGKRSLGGLLPTDDSIENARMVGRVLKSEGGVRVRVVTNREMRHAWHIQDSDLFARSVVAWVEEESVLVEEGFEHVGDV